MIQNKQKDNINDKTRVASLWKKPF